MMKTSPKFTGRRAALATLASLAVGAAALPTSALAQAPYPSKLITIIVPFSAGGTTDILARIVAQGLTAELGQSVVIDNRPGAGGNLGVDQVAKAPADGYTLVMGQTSNLAINPSLYSKLPYDPQKDLTPVVAVSNSPIVFAVSESSPYKTFADVVAASKKSPGKITLGYSGNGTVAHLAGELAQDATGIKLRHVPYKGAAQALTDVVSGNIDLYMSSIPTLIGQVRNGKMHAVAVTSKQRSTQLPQTATLAESGYKDFEAITWFGVMAPAGTPPAIVQQLNKAINQALAQADTAERLRFEGGDVLGGSVESFQQLLKTELPRWAKIVKDSGAGLD